MCLQGKQSEVINMSEKEKKTLERISDTVQKLDSDKQHYILGYAEAMADMREAESKTEERGEN